MVTLLKASARTLALVAAVGVGAADANATSDALSPPKPAQIDRNGVMILIRSTLIALDQANKTGNYTVLRDLGAPAFQVNTAARLSEIFAAERRDHLDLSGIAVLEPQLSLLPQIESNGLMHMTGFFPSAPAQLNFDVAFAPVDGQWKLFGLTVGVGQSSPAAPQQPTTASPRPQASDAPKKSHKARAKAERETTQ